LNLKYLKARLDWRTSQLRMEPRRGKAIIYRVTFPLDRDALSLGALDVESVELVDVESPGEGLLKNIP